jgi:hypothetical protein
MAMGILCCHVGLLLWPLAGVLLVNLVRQKRRTGVIQSIVWIAFCVWQGWGAVQVVAWTWSAFGEWALNSFSSTYS